MRLFEPRATSPLDPAHRQADHPFCKSGKGNKVWQEYEFCWLAGNLMENFCVNERVKHNHYAGRMVNPWFWRTYDPKELDFVEESGGKFAGFELKWGGGSSRGAKTFQAVYPGSTVEVIEPGNVWDFAGVPVKGDRVEPRGNTV